MGTRIARDFRFAARMLARQPGFAARMALTLALGTGATTALFSVVDNALLRPLPYPASERLVSVVQLDPEYGETPFGPPFLADLRERIRTLDGLAGFSPSWTMTMTEVGEPRTVVAAFVTDGLLDLLGAVPVAGRRFSPAEHAPGGAPAALVSMAFWDRHFGPVPFDERTIVLDRQRVPIVGVLPSGLRMPITRHAVSRVDDSAEIWLPFAANPYAEARAVPVMNVIGRLGDGVTLGRARLEVSGVGASLASDFPDSGVRSSVTVVSLRELVTREARTPVLVLFAAAGLLLLIACVNAANLLLARSAARRRELAVRASLGASRHQVAGQLLAESLLVAVAGSAAGLLMAWWLLSAVPALGLRGLPPSAHVAVDLRVAAFSALLAGVTTLGFGLLPALQAARNAPGDALREGSRAVAGGGRLRGGLVAAQVALALTLLVGSTLLARSFWNLVRVDPGFDVRGLVRAPLSVGADGDGAPELRRAFLDELLASLAALPGVSGVGAVNRFPLTGSNVLVGVEVEGVAPADGRLPTVDRRVATPGYFDVMGIPLVEGRDFAAADVPDAGLAVAIVNRAFARRFWPEGGAVGRRVRLMLQGGPGPWLEVVGVTADVRHHGLDRPPEAELYVPYSQAAVASMVVLVRTASDPPGLVAPIKERIWELNGDLPLDGVEPVAAVVSGSVAEPRLRMLVLNGFALLALLLATVGVYGVVSYSVAGRTREIGVRVALGARSGQILQLVVREGLVLAAWGIALGLGGAALVGRVLRGLLFGVSPTDPITLAGASALLVLFAAVASYLPARRAAGQDPVRALGAE